MVENFDLEKKRQSLSIIIKKNKVNKNIISVLRLFAFLLSIAILYYYLAEHIPFLWWGSIAFLLVFIGLIFFSTYFQERIDFANAQNQIIDDIQMEYRPQKFSEIEVSEHPYCVDLDILGAQSIFSLLNKTQSIIGARRLLKYLLNPLISKNEILERQKSVEELAEKMDWNIYILARTAQLKLKSWHNNPTDTIEKIEPESRTLRLSLFILPILYFVMIVLSFLLHSYMLGGLAVLLMVAVSYYFAHRYDHRMSVAFENAEKNTKNFAGFVSVFEMIEKEDFSTKNNKSLQQKLKKPLASQSLKSLGRQLKNLENGHANFFGFVLNLFLLWNLRYTLKIEKLTLQFQEKIPEWMNSVFEFEALISLGIYRYLHPNYILPEISSDSGSLVATEITHPLMSDNEAVNNDFKILNQQNIAIITGANMTGKSTFLRTVGTNLILAMNGVSIHAKKFSFQPMKVFTSMRNSDSLARGSSYFHAEIYRLKQIKEDLESGIPLFIILDEILKGTNSTDKLTGSKLFLEKIISLETPFSCLIATHDLELTALAEENETHVSNYCFDLQTVGAELVADYKIKAGKTTRMNALFLMRKIGIID